MGYVAVLATLPVGALLLLTVVVSAMAKVTSARLATATDRTFNFIFCLWAEGCVRLTYNLSGSRNYSGSALVDN